MIAVAFWPTARPSSSAAALVIEAVIPVPLQSRRTMVVVTPLSMAVIGAGNLVAGAEFHEALLEGQGDGPGLARDGAQTARPVSVRSTATVTPYTWLSRSPVKTSRAPFRDDPALVHQDDAGVEREGLVGVVGRQDHGMAAAAGEVGDARQHPRLVAEVEARGRFVHDQDRRLLRERAGDHHHLPLPAREARVIGARQIADPEPGRALRARPPGPRPKGRQGRESARCGPSGPPPRPRRERAAHGPAGHRRGLSRCRDRLIRPRARRRAGCARRVAGSGRGACGRAWSCRSRWGRAGRRSRRRDGQRNVPTHHAAPWPMDSPRPRSCPAPAPAGEEIEKERRAQTAVRMPSGISMVASVRQSVSTRSRYPAPEDRRDRQERGEGRPHDHPRDMRDDEARPSPRRRRWPRPRP
jgi:hypothetical protein